MFKLPTQKLGLQVSKYFAASFAKCVSKNISGTVAFSFVIFPVKPSILLVSDRAGFSEVVLSFSTKDKPAFIKMLWSHPPIWDTSTKRLPQQKRTHKSHVSVAGEMDNDITAERARKQSTKRF